MSVKLLTEHHLEFLILKGGCTGSSESTLVKMPHCWESHVTAQISKYNQIRQFSSSEQQTISSVIGAVTCDFQQCGILTSVDSDGPVQPAIKLGNSK